MLARLLTRLYPPSLYVGRKYQVMNRGVFYQGGWKESLGSGDFSVHAGGGREQRWGR